MNDATWKIKDAASRKKRASDKLRGLKKSRENL